MAILDSHLISGDLHRAPSGLAVLVGPDQVSVGLPVVQGVQEVLATWVLGVLGLLVVLRQVVLTDHQETTDSVHPVDRRDHPPLSPEEICPTFPFHLPGGTIKAVVQAVRRRRVVGTMEVVVNIKKKKSHRCQNQSLRCRPFLITNCPPV